MNILDISTKLDSVGKRIRYLRTALGLNQNEFSVRYGAKSKMAASRWESDGAYPSIPVLIQMAEDGKVTLDWLLKGGPITISNGVFRVNDNQGGYTVGDLKAKEQKINNLEKNIYILEAQLELLKELVLKKGD